MAERRQLKTGVRAGDGPPPGYFWWVGILDFASGKLRTPECITIPASGHAGERGCGLRATLRLPGRDIKPIDQIYEIRDKGGPLGGLNIRLFFGIDTENRVLVILGIIKKQNSGKTPLGDKVTMCRRWRKYLAGDYGGLTG